MKLIKVLLEEIQTALDSSDSELWAEDLLLELYELEPKVVNQVVLALTNGRTLDELISKAQSLEEAKFIGYTEEDEVIKSINCELCNGDGFYFDTEVDDFVDCICK